MQNIQYKRARQASSESGVSSAIKSPIIPQPSATYKSLFSISSAFVLMHPPTEDSPIPFLPCSPISNMWIPLISSFGVCGHGVCISVCCTVILRRSQAPNCCAAAGGSGTDPLTSYPVFAFLTDGEKQMKRRRMRRQRQCQRAGKEHHGWRRISTKQKVRGRKTRREVEFEIYTLKTSEVKSRRVVPVFRFSYQSRGIFWIRLIYHRVCNESLFYEQHKGVIKSFIACEYERIDCLHISCNSLK